MVQEMRGGSAGRSALSRFLIVALVGCQLACLFYFSIRKTVSRRMRAALFGCCTTIRPSSVVNYDLYHVPQEEEVNGCNQETHGDMGKMPLAPGGAHESFWP